MKRQRENPSTPNEPRFKIQRTNPSSAQYKQLKVEDALAYLEQVKQKFKEKPQVYNKFLDIMKDFKSQAIDTPGVIQRVSDLFKGNTALILGFNTFLPPGYKIEIDEETQEPIASIPSQTSGTTTATPPAGAPAGQQQPASSTPQQTVSASTLTIGNRAAATEEKEEKKKLAVVSAATAGTPTTAAAAVAAAAVTGSGKQSIDFDQAISYVTKIKVRFQDQPDTYKAFLDILHTYQKEQTTIKRVYEQVSSLFKDHPDLLDEFAQFLPVPVSAPAQKKKGTSKIKASKKDVPRRKRTSARRADELIKRQAVGEGGEQVAEAGENANGYEDDKYEKKEFAGKANVSKYGPSYRLLPRNYPQPICSERSDLCNEVLNDELVSVPAGSEEGRDVYKKTPYDETLYQCEDDRCELDIVVEQNISTIRFLQPFADKLKKEEKFTFPFDQLQDIHRASIGRIYAEKGNDVLEGLRKVPNVAIPVVLKRLKQKDEEWQLARKELNKFWREIYEKNYERAQENQAQTFKQFDKKKLNSRNILNDLQTRNDYSKHLLVQLKDSSAHQDIFTLIRKIEMQSPADLDKIKTLYKNFIIPFFNIRKQNVDEKGELGILIQTEHKPSADETAFVPIVEQSLGKTPNKQLFYGNSSLVLFMRYYQMLFHRLSKAKELALKNASRKYAANMEIIKKHEALQEGRMISNGMSVEDNKLMNEQEMEDTATASLENRGTGLANYQLFLTLAGQFVGNTIESQKFEEEAKRLLGFEAYITYTFDRLITNLQKQLQTIINDEQSLQLVDAYNYERKRVNRLLDKSYVTHVSKLLTNDVIFGMKNYLDTRRMAVYIYNPPEVDVEREKAELKAFKYVEKFVNSSTLRSLAPEPAVQQQQQQQQQQQGEPAAQQPQQPQDQSRPPRTNAKLFLARNKKKKSETEALENIVIRNGLECKLCIATMKFFYVEDTEDIMWRRRGASSEQRTQRMKLFDLKRREKWNSILASKE